MGAETYTENGISNGHVNNDNISTVDDHFAFFNYICERANEYYIVQKAKGTYDATKHSCSLLERTLDNVENRVQEAAQYSAPIYEHYVFPSADRLVGMYNRSVEGSKMAVDKTKNTAVTVSTLALGLALVATQMGLIVGTAATNLFLDSVIATKNTGEKVISKTYSAEQMAEEYIHNAINVSRDILNQPKEKMTEHANSFLDIANTVFERILNLSPVQEDPESSLTERVKHLAHRIGSGLSVRANSNIVEPCQRQMQSVVEQLQRGLVLVDYVKKQQQWTFQQAGQLSSSVHEFRAMVENEAKQALTTPEDALLRSIRHSSSKLNDYLLKLRTTASEVLHESVQRKLEAASVYVEQLDSSFVRAENVYQVKDEVLEEARVKLQEIAQWTSSLVAKDNQQNGTTSNSHHQ